LHLHLRHFATVVFQHVIGVGGVSGVGRWCHVVLWQMVVAVTIVHVVLVLVGLRLVKMVLS
jgi:hypothetical protein